jgi:hypothetical protein
MLDERHRMDQPVVERLPLTSLVTPFGPAALRGDLSESDVKNLLRGGPVHFLIADVGKPIQWIAEADCFRFWKEEVQPHLAAGDDVWRLEEYRGQYCYDATHWQSGPLPIVVLAMHH